jgi:hypothetical protein
MVVNRTVRIVVALIVLVSIAVAAFLFLRLRATVRLLRREVTVIRRPGLSRTSQTRKRDARTQLENIAPLATVSVSSVEESHRQTSGGVADGDAADADAWLAGSNLQGAWIRLTWDRPATVAAIELYDLPDLADNVLAGSLEFDDGEMMTVPALPPDGSPWRVTFAPKTVHSVTFRINRVQGRQTGLAEIMVYGAVNP